MLAKKPRRKRVVCVNCSGSAKGMRNAKTLCPFCKGKGYVLAVPT